MEFFCHPYTNELLADLEASAAMLCQPGGLETRLRAWFTEYTLTEASELAEPELAIGAFQQAQLPAMRRAVQGNVA